MKVITSASIKKPTKRREPKRVRLKPGFLIEIPPCIELEPSNERTLYCKNYTSKIDGL
jgi:hypothetical protein